MQAKIQAQLAGVGTGFLPRHLIQSYLASGDLVEKTCSVPRVNPPLFIGWHKSNDGKAREWFTRELTHKKWL